MIRLIQQDNFLIGDKADIESLATKDSARVLVISDSHRDASTFLSIIKSYGKGCDALVFCGDGAYDLLSILELCSKNDDIKINMPPVLAFAQGNGDPSSCPADFLEKEKRFFDFFNNSVPSLKIPSRQNFTVCGKRIFISHGHLQGVDWGDERLISEAQVEDCQIIMHGHTHVRREDRLNGFYIVNPGSISRPRDGLPPSFAITTIQQNVLDTNFIAVTN